MAKTKFFRVAVEGATTDGRTIDRQSLIEMAASYNPATYQARVNMEHIRGFSAEPPFNAYGDVLALKTDTIQLDIGGKTEDRLALFAEIEALDPLVQMNKKGQKLFTSIEINPNFAGTGKAYLMGLAVTDSPASLGTEMLKFCATQGPNSPLAARKQGAQNEFSEALETSLQLVDDAAAEDPQGFAAQFKAFLSSLTGAPAAPATVTPAPAAPAAPAAAAPAAAAPDASFTALTALVGQLGQTVEQLSRAQAEEARRLREDLSNLTTKLDATPDTRTPTRPLGMGFSAAAGADLATVF